MPASPPPRPAPRPSPPADRPLPGRRPALRPLLAIDAATCLAFGATLVSFAAWLGRVAGLPPALLAEAGVLLLGFGAILAASLTRPTTARRMASVAVFVNALWCVASVATIVVHAATLTVPGEALVLTQALAVAVLAALERHAARGAGHAADDAVGATSA